MLKASNLFALMLVFVVTGVAINAQTPEQQIERRVEVVVGDDDSYLGVQTEEVTKDNFSKYGLKEVRGVVVEKVMENSPAKQAGLQDGDVIVRFNGEDVTSRRKLTRLIGEVAPEHQVKLTVLRGGNEREVTATVKKRPISAMTGGSFGSFPMGSGGVFSRTIPPGAAIRQAPGVIMQGLPEGADDNVFVWRGEGEGGNFVFSSTRQIGVGVSSLTKQLGDYFGVADGKGILINNVNENSPAAKAGLKAGDVIVEVEGKAIANTMDLMRGMSEKKEGEVTLTIVRNKNRQTVKVTPEKMKEGETQFRIGQPGAVRVVPGTGRVLY